jgi:hypothetical protein
VKFTLLLAACCSTVLLHAQELFPYTESASNMPSHSLSAKGTAMFENNSYTDKFVQRYAPELMFGLNKKWMVHTGATFSNMYSTNLRGESVRLYAKYRFFSNDAVHKHFRMAAFVLGSYSRNPVHYNELNLFGDQSGVQTGLIATQLLNKVAVSGTASVTEVLNEARWEKVLGDAFAWQAVNYSLSAGYLLFPVHYTNYKQTNVNLYIELLGSRNLGFTAEKYFMDLAPAVQAIFTSTSKLSVGYRFQLAGDVRRMANRSFMVSYEYIFLNALRRK